MKPARSWFTVVGEWQDGTATVDWVLATDADNASAKAQAKADSDEWWMVAVFRGKQVAETTA